MPIGRRSKGNDEGQKAQHRAVVRMKGSIHLMPPGPLH
jgi:hypothetical protein